jgi:lysozyme
MSAILGNAGKVLIQSFESLKLAAYQDQRGIWTIGWGHVSPSVVENLTCTPSEADAWFVDDTQTAVNEVNVVIATHCTQNQFDAMCSLCFNIGAHAFANSTLVKLMNAGDTAGAAAQFLVWDHVDGAPDAGLLRRRQAEQALFLS